jgi:hypothetical protein
MDLLPGPGAFRSPLPLGPRVATPQLFEGLADLIAPTLTSADDGLSANSDQVGRDVPPAADTVYATSAGVAEAVHANQARVQDTTTTPALVDTGAGADAYRANALPFLPQPSTPIELGFEDLPPLPQPEPSPGEGGPPPAI